MVNAKTFLEKRYSEDMELEDAIHTALLTLKEGFEGAAGLGCVGGGERGGEEGPACGPSRTHSSAHAGRGTLLSASVAPRRMRGRGD